MYGICAYIWLIFLVNVAKYTIHGSYGICIKPKHASKTKCPIFTSWWFQPIWKYKSNWIISPGSEGNKKSLKPPASLWCFNNRFYIIDIYIYPCVSNLTILPYPYRYLCGQSWGKQLRPVCHHVPTQLGLKQTVDGSEIPNNQPGM